MDTSQWPQGIGVTNNNNVVETTRAVTAEKKLARPEKEKELNCPRCNSTNTKFCYYNNYSLSQPRYFCKSCRRYWTEGGSLRNVPVGGGSRKNRRPSSASSSNWNSNNQSKPSTMMCFPQNPNLPFPPPTPQHNNLGGNSGILHLSPFHIPVMPVSGDHHHQSTNTTGLLFPFHDVKPSPAPFGNFTSNDSGAARVFSPNLEDMKSGFEQYRIWNGTQGSGDDGSGGW